ncbi:MAG TPA: hypothetical protein VFT55_03765 [Planctomycetota bacterium]|nr:hypothetical protein [Planctomycetota bacterium]
MSDEPIGTIEKDILRAWSVTYPFVKGNDVVKKYRVRFIPCTYSIDSNGEVASVPDGWLPDELVIDEMLHDIWKPAPLPDLKVYDPIRTLWKKHEFAQLRAGIDKILALPDQPAEVKETLGVLSKALDKKQEEQLARVAELGKGPDFYGCTMQLERIERAWKPLTPAVEARKHLDRFAGDEKIKKEVAVGRLLAKVMTEVDTSKPAVLRALTEELNQFRKKHDGTFAGQVALREFTRLAGR